MNEGEEHTDLLSRRGVGVGVLLLSGCHDDALLLPPIGARVAHPHGSLQCKETVRPRVAAVATASAPQRPGHLAWEVYVKRKARAMFVHMLDTSFISSASQRSKNHGSTSVARLD
ncbi:hypothetical protein AVEN_73122-1 [Araneus ventricosus]|uniref:Uncharacterized protein n=1 Tax=Araneus ventricosus TaxID=182803 RepID=A0A4Y2RPU9_ARAVE|nr:hypothetical protein AVEN_73122-1 [Araneus ventricosus]